MVTGGVAAELDKSLDMHQKYEEFYHFMKFSLEIHNIPSNIKFDCVKHLSLIEDAEDAQPQYIYQDFFSFLSQKDYYEVQFHIFHDWLNEMSLFEFSNSNEIMFIAYRMKTQLYIANENVV